jgi:diguanylate cyclase
MVDGDSRERSAELFRLVVGFMGRQQAGFSPENYRLWYEYASGSNPALSQAIDARQANGTPLSEAEARQLYLQHIVPRERDAMERAQERLYRLMREASAAISQTGLHAAQFEETLDGHSSRLRAMPALDTINEIVAEVLKETQKISASNRSLAQQLETSASEVITLTQNLERAQAEAVNDPLTGLFNRRGFEQAIIKAYETTEQLPGASLLLADLDRFKQINDAHGHLVGDQVLRVFAQVLRSRIKGADIAARLGGDEFAVLMPETNLAGAMTLAEQIRTKLMQGRLRPFDREETLGGVTVSIGVAQAEGATTLEGILKHADVALYAAKNSGRNCISAFKEQVA